MHGADSAIMFERGAAQTVSMMAASARVVDKFTIDFTDTFTTIALGWGIYVSKFSMIRNSPTLAGVWAGT